MLLQLITFIIAISTYYFLSITVTYLLSIILTFVAYKYFD